MKKIIYRTCEADYYDVSQEFSEFEPDYVLNDSGDDLIIVGSTNIKELIQSNADCALSAILDKFLGPDYLKGNILDDFNVVDSGHVHEVEEILDDFDLVDSTLDDLAFLKNELKLDSTSSLRDILIAYNNKYKKEKGVDINEKKIEEESKQEEL